MKNRIKSIIESLENPSLWKISDALKKEFGKNKVVVDYSFIIIKKNKERFAICSEANCEEPDEIVNGFAIGKLS